MKRIIAFAGIVVSSVFLSCGFYTIDSSVVVTAKPIEKRAPYANVVKYYGYIDPAVKSDGMYRGKKAYYLYFWVPAAIDEVGIAMYSPSDGTPGSGDFKGPKFHENFNKDNKSFFDTYVALERIPVMDSAKIKKAKGAAGMVLGENDDTGEIPANPGGQHYNSVLRVLTNTRNPTKALVRSVYRITFTSFRGNIKGSFVAQVGTNIPGVKIASSLEELDKLVNAK